MGELNDNKILNNDDYTIFDDSEYDDLIGNEDEVIEIDEEFEKKASKELDDYLKENPLRYDD